MNQDIEESGMTFSFNENDLFHIEKCATFSAMSQGVKIVEFIVNQSERLVFIEAKKSSPKPDKDNVDFDIFITEIYEKFQNSLLLYIGLMLSRPFSTQSIIPKNHSINQLKHAKIQFYLIINGHKDEWLPPIDEALNLRLKAVKKCFAISSIKVLNDKMALNYNLITTKKDD
jgi:hypothetical protein